MTKLLPLYGICFALAYMCDKTSVYDYGKERYVYKSRIWFFVLSAIAIVFAGLRTNYNDTSTYIGIYDSISLDQGFFHGFSWLLGDHPGFYLVTRVFKLLHFSSQTFIMVWSLFSTAVQLWFIRKYANDTGVAVYLFFTIGCFSFTLAAVKQCAAIAICLIAVDRLIHKQYLIFILLTLLAATFHPFCILFILCPVLFFKPWSKYTMVVFLASLITGVTLQYWLSDALDFVSMMGIEYDIKNLSGEGVNIFRVAVLWSPVILSAFAYWRSGGTNDRIQNLMINLMMLNATIMFVALFGNPIYFGRLSNYFLIFQTVGLTWLLQYFNRDSRKVLIVIVVILYFAYSYYGHALNGATFDESFRSMNLSTYLKNIFIR